MLNRIWILALLLAACASTETKKRELKERLDKRVGHSVDALVAEVGPPSRTLPKGPPGAFMYVYEWAALGYDCSITYSIENGRVSGASWQMYSDSCY